jgi:hypothetical protein
MANELTYIIRLNAEGVPEVRKATKTVKKTGNQVARTNKQISNSKKAYKEGSKEAKHFAKANSEANIALLDLTRVAQDAPYGLRGIANNLQQVSLSAGRAYHRFGNLGDTIKGIGRAIMGPLGLVVGMTALTVAPALLHKIFSLFGSGADEVEKARRQVELFNDAIQSEVNARLGNDNLDANITAVNHAIDSLMHFNDIKKASNMTLQQSLDLFEKNNKAFMRYGQLSTAQTDATQQNIQGLNQLIDHGKNIDQQVLKILDKQLAKMKAKKLVQQKLNKIGLVKPLDEKDIFGTSLKDFKIKVPLLSGDTDQLKKANKQSLKRMTDHIAAQGKARMAMEKTLNQKRLRLAKLGGDKIHALNVEEQQKKDKIKDNGLITDKQRQKAMTLTHQIFAKKRADITKKEEAQKRRERQRTLQSMEYALSSMQRGLMSFDRSFLKRHKKLSKAVFAANKALSISTAIMNTKQAVTKALASAPPPLNFVEAGIVSAAGLAQVAGIASQSFGGGAMGGAVGGASGSVGYRGLDFAGGQVRPPAPGPRRRPWPGDSAEDSRPESREIRITDGFGNMVAKGQEEIDAKGGSGYLRGEDNG